MWPQYMAIFYHLFQDTINFKIIEMSANNKLMGLVLILTVQVDITKTKQFISKFETLHLFQLLK